MSDRPDSLQSLFEPRTVAVVGASDAPGKLGTMLMRNLEHFAGSVVPITPSRAQVGGRRAYASLRDVPGGVELAIAAVPAGAVADVVDDAVASGVGTVVVLSGGFAEIGPDGAALQARIVSAARAGGLRIVGPNCLGVQNCATGLNASMAAGTPDRAGRISLATQSGAYGMAIYMLGLEQRMGFAKVYAAGNKADVTDAEVLAHLSADDDTGVICFFVESLSDARRFYELARETTARKPILVTRTGRTAAGARAALSHTAALAGDAAVWRAALEQAGVLLAANGLEMIDAAKALDWQPAPQGARAAIITNSGGTGVELCDLLSEEGLEVPELSPQLQARLAQALPAHGSARNPVDVTTVWSRFAELYPLAIDELARSGEVDLVIAVLLQRSAMDRVVAESVRDAVARLRADAVTVPVYVCWVAPQQARPNADLLQEARVPCFEWPARTARSVAAACRYGRARATLRPPPAVRPRPEQLPAIADGVLDPPQAAQLVRAFGVDVAAHELCHDPESAAAAAGRLGFPVAAKLAGGRHVHKSDVGGVRLGLRGRDAVRDAAAELLALDPDALVLVQPMTAGTEVIVGGVRDPDFGPTVVVGLGGVLVEVLGDAAVRVAPIDLDDAHAAVRSLRGFALLAGARGRPPANLDALASTLVAVSQLMACMPEIRELDLNPVMCSPDGAVAVDVRVVGDAGAGGAPSQASDGSRLLAWG